MSHVTGDVQEDEGSDLILAPAETQPCCFHSGTKQTCLTEDDLSDTWHIQFVGLDTDTRTRGRPTPPRSSLPTPAATLMRIRLLSQVS